MPVRINPIYDLRPCTLNLNSIEKIIELVSSQFSDVQCFAIDSTWEIYEEAPQSFLGAISQRQVLNSFRVIGFTPSAVGPDKEIQIVFSEAEAKVSLKAHPNEENWFEHFLFDLKKLVLPPTFAQLMAISGDTSIGYGLKISGTIAKPNIKLTAPYCRIILRQKPPDPFWENIKANLVSNLIWVILVFILGVLATLITTGQLKINIP